MVYRGIADDGSGGCQVFYENLTCNVSPFAVRQIWNGLMFKFGGKIL